MFLGLSVPPFGLPEANAGAWSREVETRLTQLEASLRSCLLDSAKCPQDSGSLWLEVRWTGGTRIVRAISGQVHAADTESHHDHNQLRLSRVTQLLSSTAVPQPSPGGGMRALVLGPALGFTRTQVALEVATPLADRSVLAVLDSFSDLAPKSVPAQSRYWILDSRGEVLFQSEGQFMGSSLETSEHFANPASRRSFDQLEVQPDWSRSALTGWLILEEKILPTSILTSGQDRTWKWIAQWGVTLLQGLWGIGMIAALGLLAFGFKRLFARYKNKRILPPSAAVQVSPVIAQVPGHAVQVRSVPTVVAPPPFERPQASLASKSKTDQEALGATTLLRARSLHDLGRRIMVSVAEAARSPVIFMEYHSQTGCLIFRDQVGLVPGQAPLGLRVQIQEHGDELQRLETLQNVLLERLGVSHLEVLELRSSTAVRVRPQLLGVFIITQPGVSSYERRNEFKNLLALAGRYYDTILRPTPPAQQFQ